MITVINRDTCKPAYIDNEIITKIEEHSEEIDGRSYPYSRVFMKEAQQKHDYFLDVVESLNKINQLIEEANEKEKLKKRSKNK